MSRPGTKLCQVEKVRTSFIIQKLFDASRNDVERALYSLKAVKVDGESREMAQLAQLIPLSDTLSTLQHSSESADKLWFELSQSKDSYWLNRLKGDFKNLTQFQIRTDSDEQVSGYIFASALLALKDLHEVSFQVEALAAISEEFVPELEKDPALKGLLKISKNELQILASGILSLTEVQEDIPGAQE